MAQKQEQLAQALLKDPAVDSLSSFIGVDGNNASLNSGRLQINLKPKGERDDIRTVLARLQQSGLHIADLATREADGRGDQPLDHGAPPLPSATICAPVLPNRRCRRPYTSSACWRPTSVCRRCCVPRASW